MVYYVRTGALGAGVDIDGIKFVVHVGKPYGMINFDQEVGRGGRSGELVMSMIMILNDDYLELLGQDGRTFGIDDAVMREFIITEGCRRRIISKYMNGEEEMMDCMTLGGELCDGCLRSGSQSGELKRRREEDERAVVELKKARGLEERQRLIQVAKMDESQRIMEARRLRGGYKGSVRYVGWLRDVLRRNMRRSIVRYGRGRWGNRLWCSVLDIWDTGTMLHVISVDCQEIYVGRIRARRSVRMRMLFY